eukprot:5657746-Amphidinium_carterae.1
MVDIELDKFGVAVKATLKRMTGCTDGLVHCLLFPLFSGFRIDAESKRYVNCSLRLQSFVFGWGTSLIIKWQKFCR